MVMVFEVSVTHVSIFQFLQNSGCRKYLLKTEGSRLVNCDPDDTFLGIGVGRFEDESNHPAQWKGKNVSGETLQKVREALLNKADLQEEVKMIRDEVKK